jgi:hypothetical protein
MSTNLSAGMLQRLCDEGDLIGNQVVADVNIRNYEGDKQNNVRRMLPPTAGFSEAAEGGSGFLED